MTGWKGVGAVTVLCAFLPLILGAHRGTWRKTAASHLQFARNLAAEGVVFDLAARARLVEGRLAACAPRGSKIRDLPVSDRMLLQQYADLVCVPSWKAWSKGFGECQDRLITPRWCDSPDDAVVAEHLGLGAYFDTMTSAMAVTSSRLEKGNILGVVADFLRDEALRHHPVGPLELWIGEAARTYLVEATPEEGLAAAESLLGAWFGSNGALPAFLAFRDSAALTDAQRCALGALIARKNPALCPGYVEPIHRPTEEEKEQERQALQEKALRPENRRRLRSRVETYYERQRDCLWDGVYDLLTVDVQELSYDRAEWRHNRKWICEKYPLVRWQVNKILVYGNKAKVFALETHRHLRGKDKGRESSKEWETYWILEEGDWRCSYGRKQYDFNDRQATDVPVEEKAR